MLEYFMLISIVTALAVAMTPMIKRFSQSMVKLAADQIGTQDGSDQQTARGYLTNSESDITQSMIKGREDLVGDITYFPYQQTKTFTMQNMDLGVSWSKEYAGQDNNGSQDSSDSDPN